MKYRFSLDEAYDFGWPGLKGRAYSDAAVFKPASAATFEVTGRHGKVKSKTSDRIYYVLAGEGEFTINDEIVLVKQSDVVIVPKNTPYDYKVRKGKLKLFLVHVPAFDPTGEVKLE